jgi:hypothetical protein
MKKLFNIVSEIVFYLVIYFTFNYFLTKINPKLEGTLTDSKIIAFSKTEDNIKHLKSNFLLN